MPRYKVTAEFSLATEIEPDRIRLDFDAEEFQDGSYWSTTSVVCDGGSVEFEVEAEDEDRAGEKTEQIIYEGMELEDYDSRTWLVESLSVEVEAIEWEPTVPEALGVLEDFIANNLDAPADEFHQRIAKAAEVVLTDYRRLGQRVTSLEAHALEATGRINDLSARLEALTPPTEVA